MSCHRSVTSCRVPVSDGAAHEGTPRGAGARGRRGNVYANPHTYALREERLAHAHTHTQCPATAHRRAEDVASVRVPGSAAATERGGRGRTAAAAKERTAARQPRRRDPLPTMSQWKPEETSRRAPTHTQRIMVEINRVQQQQQQPPPAPAPNTKNARGPAKRRAARAVEQRARLDSPRRAASTQPRRHACMHTSTAAAIVANRRTRRRWERREDTVPERVQARGC